MAVPSGVAIAPSERMAASGRFPGGFIKREGRPTNREILTCRLADRPIRPLFPKGFIDEVIHPHSTRKRIALGLRKLRNKALENPDKKHGNIPL